MRKRDFLGHFAVASFAAPFATLRFEAADEETALIGLWEAIVKGQGATYRYLYSFSRGSYVATGNIDENFMGLRYSPTMGAYTSEGDGAYKYREHGYAFDLKGRNVGTFASTGTFRLDANLRAFRGPGTFTQYDLKLKPVEVEPFTLAAARIDV